MKHLALCLLALSFSVALAGPARADRPKVAIGDVEGPTGAQIGYAIERALRDNVDVVPNRTWTAEATRQKAAPASTEDASRIGAALEVDAAVVGRVTREGRNWQVVIDLVQVRSGQVGKSWTFQNSQLSSLSQTARRQAWVQLQGPIRAAAALPAGGPAPAPAAQAPAEETATPELPKRVVMLPFEGGKMADTTRIDIAKSLNDSGKVEFVRLGEATQEAERIGADLEQPVGRVAVAEFLKVDAFVGGRIFTRSGQYYGRVDIYQGQDGEAVDTLKLKRRSLSTLQEALSERALDPVLRARRPGAGISLDLGDMAAVGVGTAGQADTSAADQTSAQTAQSEPDPPKRARGADVRSRTPFEFELGFQSFFRRFTFNDPLTPSRDYSANFLPAVVLSGRWYPAAHFIDEGIARNLGLAIEADYGIGLSSEDAVSGARFNTNAFAFMGSGRLRVPLQASEIGFEVGYGTDRFSLDPSERGEEPGTPNSEYEFVRLAADARWRVAKPLDLSLGAGYRILTTAGDLGSEDWFENLSGGGLETEFAIGTPILDPLHLEAAFTFDHYFFSFNPEPGDAQVAGGALDQYFGGQIRAIFVL